MAETQDSSLQSTTQPNNSQPSTTTSPPTQPITPPPAATTPPAATPPAPPADWRFAGVAVVVISVAAVLLMAIVTLAVLISMLKPSFPAPAQIALAMPAAPGQRVTQTQIVSNAGYNIVGDIIISGMNIREDELRELLNQQTGVAEGEDAYRHLLINGRVPDRFVERMKQVLTPQFFAQNTGEMCVVFNLDVNSTMREVRVKTGDFMTTLAYFLAVRNSPGVIVRVGEPPAQVTGFYNTDVFPRNVIFTVGDTIVGTPYNFVPLAAFKQPSDATVGNLKLPEVNTD